MRRRAILVSGILLWSSLCLASTEPGTAADGTGKASRPDLETTIPPLPPPSSSDDASVPKHASQSGSLYKVVTGREAVHTVAAGETLGAIAKRYGTGVQVAAAMNSITDPTRLQLGQKLILSNRRVLPTPLQEGLVADLSTLRMYRIQDGEVTATFPIAAGRKTWETPAGQYSITGRRRDPIWHVPPSIQREMKEQGVPVKTKVPAGPDNPLGKYWLQLSANGLGIHGTNAPWSVGKFATHGCIRMREADIERLYNEVPNGTRVAIIDEAVRIARTSDGRVFVEAHRSGKQLSDQLLAQRFIAAGLTDESDRQRALHVVRDAWGVAVEVLPGPATQQHASR